MALADSPAAGSSWTRLAEEDAHEVFAALADRDYDFRTVDGIADSTRIPVERVREILDQHSDLVRLSAVPGPNREPLYTLSERPVTAREQLALAQSVVASPVS